MSVSFAVVFAMLTVIGLGTFGLFDGWTARRAASIAAVVLSAAVATLIALGVLGTDVRLFSTVLAIAGVVFNVAAFLRRDPLPHPIWSKERR